VEEDQEIMSSWRWWSRRIIELVHQLSVCGATAYPITVGAGGAAGASPGAGTAATSSFSIFNNHISRWGRRGWRNKWFHARCNAGTGGSGGGAGYVYGVNGQVEQVTLHQ
jgi:hypothetical protein